MLRPKVQPMLSDDVRDALFALERAMWAAATRYDPDFQETRFAQDFLEFGRSGQVYTRAQIILPEGAPIDATLTGLHARPLSPEHVQLVYDCAVRDADGVVRHAHRSSLWSRLGDRWVMRFHQATPYEPGD
ncbi:nuclear transport factor 2 family protein [Pseudoxanthomonas winnipegensis]|jgi:hypothetical protein|uniref:Nuclear transport factor 2 family protein n=2 Tax=Pseudoxanthomonas winnipegensis TaxID=2480810 RepID=A0A4Q8L9Y1_9GAMM|nr:nuclear transport factor 2 family protein [Pseudoxanthomonas winnipegensis]